MVRRTDDEVRVRIAEIEKEASLFGVEEYEQVVYMMRAQIKGLKYALGEDYSIHEGK
jgi:hypothetical protein